MRGLYLIYVIGAIVVTTISGWIVTVRMRRRARNALGVDLNETQLTSLQTWMKVEDAEERRRGGRIS